MHDPERPSIPERLGRIISRGNLRQREGACDLDALTALGVVGIHERLSHAVFRLKYANDHRSYGDALDGVSGLARVLNNRLRWKMRRRLDRMAKRVLDYWLADGCRLCTGVGFEVIRNSPHLSDRPCAKCHGSRKREMPWLRRLPKEPEGRRVTKAHRLRWRASCRMRQAFMDAHRRLLVELENAERRICERMRVKLSRAA